MSFGFSVSDIITLTKLISDGYHGWKDATHDYADFKADWSGFEVVLRRLKSVGEDLQPSRSFITLTDDETKDWKKLYTKCEDARRSLKSELKKYQSLGKSRARNRDRVSFDRRALTKLTDRLHRRLQILLAFLFAIGCCSRDKFDDKFSILVEKIDKMAEQARKGNSTIRSSTTVRTSASDNQEVWEDIRAGLTGQASVKKYEVPLKTYVYSLYQKGLLDEETPINNHAGLDKVTEIEEVFESPIDNKIPETAATPFTIRPDTHFKRPGIYFKPPGTATTPSTIRPDTGNFLHQDSPLIGLKELPSVRRSKQSSPPPQKPLEHKGSPGSQTLSSAGKDILPDGESSFLETTPTEGTIAIPTYEDRLSVDDGETQKVLAEVKLSSEKRENEDKETDSEVDDPDNLFPGSPKPIEVDSQPICMNKNVKITDSDVVRIEVRTKHDMRRIVHHLMRAQSEFLKMNAVIEDLPSSPSPQNTEAHIFLENWAQLRKSWYELMEFQVKEDSKADNFTVFREGSPITHLLAKARLIDSALESKCFYLATELALRVLETTIDLYGNLDRRTLRIIANLSYMHLRQDSWDSAICFGNRAIEGLSKVYGGDIHDTFTAMESLAFALEKKMEWKSAITWQVRIHKMNAKFHGENHGATLSSMADLVRLYVQVGNNSEANNFGHVIIRNQDQMLKSENYCERLGRFTISWDLLGHKSSALALALVCSTRGASTEYGQYLDLNPDQRQLERKRYGIGEDGQWPLLAPFLSINFQYIFPGDD